MKTPLHIIQKIQQNQAEKETILDLRSQALLEVPPEIRVLTHLEQVLLKDNAIQCLPAWLNELPRLQFIQLNINPLHDVGQVRNLVLDWGVWWRLRPADEQVAGLWLRWEEGEMLEAALALPNLRWLDLSEQRLREVPERVWGLERLRVLIMSGNKLNVLSPKIINLQNLTQFDLSYNKINILSSEIMQLKNLVQLNLGNNKLNLFPSEIIQLQSLTHLNLEGNGLNTLLLGISKLQNLTQLNLGGNGLNTLLPEISKLQNLTQLNLGGNGLNILLPEISKLQNLTQLVLGNNTILTLPPEILQLQNLTLLDLRNNKLRTFPSEITNLQNLMQLNLGGNELNILPAKITQLQNLTKLDLRNNKLCTLQPEILQLPNLTQLNLWDNKLNTLPSEIIQLQNLTQLYLSYNALRIFPPEITRLQNLTLLDLKDLKNNELEIFLPKILQLQSLMQLNLGGNKLDRLPLEINKLKNLTQLNLGGNRLGTLPLEVCQLPNLTQLSLGGNGLRTLPSEIKQLKNLTLLNLAGNGLRTLPLEITQLQNLTQLYLKNNALRTLPPQITQLHDLGGLDLKNNPLESPPLESLALESGVIGNWHFAGTADITKLRAYFRQAAESELDYLYEAKLLIVGEGGAGKTSLARRIVDAEADLPEEEESTRGIDITQWEFEWSPSLGSGVKQEDTQAKAWTPENIFRVNIWDFGGQQIYHATHQFFLTKRSMYALVADTREERNNFYDWLNRIELFSDSSPVCIVKNQRANRPPVKIDEPALRERFLNLERAFTCNLNSNEGRDALLQYLCNRIQELPHVGHALPKTWLKVRRILETDQRNTISRDEYLQICQQNGFTRREDALQLSSYLHDLGVCLHFQDDELLARTVILKPTWGTDAVYKVLDSDCVQNGYFTTADLQKIWHETQYADMRPELLRLMMNFKLCYELPEAGYYIAPQLLSEQKPTYDWNPQANLQLRYSYPRFMPNGILTRFIVSIHHLIEDQRERVWQNGVVLSDNHTRAEVREDIERREIRLRLSGQHKRDLLAYLVGKFEEIHRTLHNLEYKRLIPCICPECTHSQEPNFYPYQTLKRYQQHGKTTIECQHSFADVDVRNLLDDMYFDRDDLPTHKSKPGTVVDKIALLDKLKNFSKPQLEEVEFRFEMPPEYKRSEVTPTQFCMDLIKYAEGQGRLEELQQVIEIVSSARGASLPLS